MIYRPPPGYTPSVRWDLYGLDSAESSFSSSRGGPLAQEKAAERDFLSLAKTAGDGATGALSGESDLKCIFASTPSFWSSLNICDAGGGGKGADEEGLP